jgi:hypothetical protein
VVVPEVAVRAAEAEPRRPGAAVAVQAAVAPAWEAAVPAQAARPRAGAALASSSAMILRMEARISSIDGSCAFAG